ncbi:MAG: hypothetical protein WC494_00320 [Candidatus Pacearchaeota archaeon]
MFKRKCPSCAKNIERKFRFCPYCGESFKKVREEKDYGLLGREDSPEVFRNEMKLPFGMEKIMDSLVKQLEKQMNEMEKSGNGHVPKGFKIKISTGNPQIKQVVQNKKPLITNNFTEEEIRERIKLPKVEAESKVRRLSDRVIYELSTPGVKSPREVIISKLASGLEIKAYSKEKCYTKFIPMTFEIIQFYIKDEKLMIELKV